jgi:hypothetical protein
LFSVQDGIDWLDMNHDEAFMSRTCRRLFLPAGEDPKQVEQFALKAE